MVFVNRVADAAEERNHHPDILVHGWNSVRLTLTTHAHGGLTEADFDLAAQIDALREARHADRPRRARRARPRGGDPGRSQAKRVRVFAVGPKST